MLTDYRRRERGAVAVRYLVDIKIIVGRVAGSALLRPGSEGAEADHARQYSSLDGYQPRQLVTKKSQDIQIQRPAMETIIVELLSSIQDQ